MQAGQSSPHMCVEYNQFFEERSGHIDMHIYIYYIIISISQNLTIYHPLVIRMNF